MVKNATSPGGSAEDWNVCIILPKYMLQILDSVRYLHDVELLSGILRMIENQGPPPFVRVLPLVIFCFLTILLSVWQIMQAFCLFFETGFSIPLRVLALILATAVSIQITVLHYRKQF